MIGVIYMVNNKYKIDDILTVLFQSWSLESSSKWSKENPASGQCGVTSLVINDLLGGEIKKTQLADGWHFYNVVNGKRYDFTASQFSEEIIYMDVPANREEAFQDTNDQQYHSLKNNFLINLKKLDV